MQYAIGDVVWAKTKASKDNVWWPASVQEPQVQQESQEVEGGIFVEYFGGSSSGYVKNHDSEILPYVKFMSEKKKHVRSKKIKQAVSEAEQYLQEKNEKNREQTDPSYDTSSHEHHDYQDSDSEPEEFEPRASISPTPVAADRTSPIRLVGSSKKILRSNSDSVGILSPPVSQPHPVARSASRTPGGTRRIRWVGDSIGSGSYGEKYYNAFRLDGDEYHVGDCVFVRMDDEEDDLWVAEVESLWEDKYTEKWFEGRWFYSATNARAHSGYGQGRTFNGRNWFNANSQHELFESDHVDENTIDCVEGKATVMIYQEFQNYSPTTNSQRKQSFFCRAFYSTKTRIVRPILGAAKRVKRAQLYSNRVIENAADQANSSDNGSDNEGPNLGKKKRASKRKHKKNHGLNKKRSKTESKIAQSNVNKEQKRNNGRVTTKHLFESCAKACAALQLSHVPKSLPCREKERKQIMNFLKSAVERGGLGSALYISGMPGTGKTATVMEVIRTLKANAVKGVNPDFEFINLNGMKLPHPFEAYSIIWRALTGQDTTPKKAAMLLERRFTTPSSKRQCCVLLVDELDYMVTRKQSVLYNLFDWPSKRYSRLVVVGIANTMDLPERLLPRIHSRLGLERVIFQGYTVSQIETIMKTRLGELDVFEDTAVEICARKVASISGDIRRALQIARRAAEICDREANQTLETRENQGENGEQSAIRPKPGSEQERRDPFVTIRHINLAHKELTTTAYILAIKQASLFERLLLAAVVLQIRGSGLDEVMYDDVIRRFEGLCRTRGGTRSQHPSRASTKLICRRLASSGLIVLDQRSMDWDWQPRIRLNVLPDDIVYALSDDNTTRSLF